MRSVSLTRQLAMLRKVRGAVGVQRHHGQRHGRIGDVVAVEVDGLERPAAAARDTRSAFGAAVNLRAHLPCCLDETDVALDGIFAHTQNFDAVLASSARSILRQAL